MNVELLIQKFITETITIDEQKMLRKILDEQPEFRENLIIENTMYQYRNERLKLELKKTIPIQKTSKASSKKALIFIMLALVLGVLGYWAYKSLNPATTVNSFVDYHINDKCISPVRLMDNGIKKIDQWSEAVDEYSANNFNKALAIIKTIKNPTSEQKLYEGMCYVYIDNPDYISANKIMESLQSPDELLVYDQALWYGALIDIKLGEIDEAESQLSKIIKDNLWKHKDAKKLSVLINDKSK